MKAVEEEIALLEEQLAAAHADIERLQEEVANASAKARTAEADGAGIRRQLEAARLELAQHEDAAAEREREIAALREGVVAADERASGAAARYRELMLAAEPALPAELVNGDSVEALDASAALARQTVAQVRQHIEQQAQAIRVPAGPAFRGPPDAPDLTPAEKIRRGLAER